MSRYFFHTADGRRDRDRQGTELPDNATARCEAVRFTGAILHDEPEKLWDGRDFRASEADG